MSIFRLGPKCLKVWSSQATSVFTWEFVCRQASKRGVILMQLHDLQNWCPRQEPVTTKSYLCWGWCKGRVSFLDLSCWENFIKCFTYETVSVWRVWQSSKQLFTILSELFLPILHVWTAQLTANTFSYYSRDKMCDGFWQIPSHCCR